ncbi:HNH endonuclease [Paramicrobacterium agarici]|uniref:Putative restriction endonuclease n=1 Tax=Paramicrobacterium agarici TaxID=630514 RepID=A0A2A9DVA7_9MICO|nr:HNH endonuclease [Microbacterium agarici]PFG29922.1 putative restriction endonuclease [Microbacterium agarici]
MYSMLEEHAIREDVFRWLDRRLEFGTPEVSREELTNYTYDGVRIPLLDASRGIRNPRDFDATLSIMTSSKGPYDDAVTDDGFVHYRYQSREGGDNRKLKRAHELGAPLVYFHGIRPGVCVATYPVYVVADDEANRTFLIALDDSLRFFGDPLHMSDHERRYGERMARQRLHQPLFRARVMHAYANTCTVCHLKHPELLDAAHIVPDTDADGLAVVPNGLTLCKMHHAAYDRNLMGISPDYVVHINGDLLQEVDGPMLKR